MNSSQLSNEDFDIKLLKVFNKLKNAQHSKVSHKFDIIDTLENKLKKSEDLLKKFSCDNLKSMLCIHSDISNKPALIDDLSTSTSHASNSELDIMPVIVDTACLENSCLNNHVMPKSNESRTKGKFVPTCYNCGKLVILGQIVIC
jgi:hypothetical protein